MKLPINKILCGAMPEAIKGFPDGSINCCISSPPYWALRDYGVDGQLGLEKTFEEYIDKLCTIYDEVKRVLRDDGTCWVNLGDTYAGSTQGGGNPEGRCDGGTKQLQKQQDSQKHIKTPLCGLQQKCLCLIPQRFAIEMVNRGWILRNVIIWHKPNPMPSSAKDRFTVDFEYVYFFVKSRKYWFEPQYEPYAPNSDMEYRKTLRLGKFYRAGNQNPYKDNTPLAGDRKMTPLAEGKNKRTVWTIPTQPFPEAHFATFPEKLVEPMIKAGCPEFVCTKCGKAREKIYETKGFPEPEYQGDDLESLRRTNNDADRRRVLSGARHAKWKAENPDIFKGYTDCGCNADWRPGIVWDCFCWLWHDLTSSCKAAA